MSRSGKRQSSATLPLSHRWRQVYDAGELVLEHFTQAELDCVALDPRSLPDRERGTALQSVSPLLAKLAAAPGGPAAGAGQSPQAPAAPAAPAADTGRDAEILAAAAAGLEKRGFIRPGPPDRGTGTLADELSGVAADPMSPGGVRPVTLAGDLALVTRMRSEPCWVAEALISPEPNRPDPAGAGWRLIGRMYAAPATAGRSAAWRPGTLRAGRIRLRQRALPARDAPCRRAGGDPQPDHCRRARPALAA